MSYQRKQYPNLAVKRTRWDLVVEAPQDGWTLIQFLKKRIRWMTDDKLDELLENSRISIVGASIDSKNPPQLYPEFSLIDQQRILVTIPPPPKVDEEDVDDPMEIPLKPLVDDGVIFVIDKQPGLPVQPTTENQMANVLSAMHARYRNEDPQLDRVPHLAHRIDIDTSGVLLMMWDRKLCTRVMRQFENRDIQKEYLAIVHGCPKSNEGEVDVPIVAKTSSPGLKYYPGSDGKEATTAWTVEEKFNNFALIRFRPRHGRTHQIRIHALYMGHPLLCDHMYGGGTKFTEDQLREMEKSPSTGDFLPLKNGSSHLRDLVDTVDLDVLSPTLAAARKDTSDIREPSWLSQTGGEPVIQRCCLHSASLSLKHPSSGKHTVLTADVPNDFLAVLEVLRSV